MNYKDAGVDIEAGNAFVKSIKNRIVSTHTQNVIGGYGGFGGMFSVPLGYEKPILVSGADGVGTKLKIAQLECGGPDKSAMHGIGIDLVAMCVNDVITCGAKPLYFLDYICTSKLNQEYLTPLIEGIVSGCHSAYCSLLGGETAEHPQHMGYADVIRDLSGFCTGIVEQSEIVDGRLIKEDDVIVGIESSGLHSNGYSLIERLLFHHKIALKETPELLTPTIIYASLVEKLMDEFPILGMAHITGGGIPENLPRCIPDGLVADVDYNSWPLPELFSKIMCDGDILEEDMKTTFNMGIGYCLVVPEEVVTDIQDKMKGWGYKSWRIGQVKKCNT